MGLITVLAAINIGMFRRGALFPGALGQDLDLAAEVVGIVLTTASQVVINHLGIDATAQLTDFSACWILLAPYRFPGPPVVPLV